MSTSKYKLILISSVSLTIIFGGGIILFLLDSIFEMSDQRLEIISKVLAVVLSIGVLFIVKKYLDKKYPQTERLATINENDERNITLRNSAFYYAGIASLVILILLHLFSGSVSEQFKLGIFIGLITLALSIGISLAIVFYKNKV